MPRSRASVSSGSPTIHIDTRDLKAFGRDLAKASPEVYRNLRDEIRGGAELVAVEARERSRWSSRIPGSIRATVTGYGATAKVTASGKKAPDAAPYENKGRHGSFRHPVFGNREVWVSQQARPFLAPSLEAKADVLAERVAGAIDTALEVAHFV